MDGAGAKPLTIFAVVSLVVHVGIGASVVGRHHAAPRPAEPAPLPQAAGETFDVPDPPPERAAPSEEDHGASTRAPRAALANAGPGTRAPRAHGGAGANGSAARSSAESPAIFGAVGDRAAIDLATAFTRGFPQAASADRAWTGAPLGPAGDVDVVLTIDDSGRLTDASIGPGASPALRAGISRTFALIRARTFTARAATTTLHLRATVSPDSVHDGLHGDVFAIGGSFASSEGSAFFALAIGRRVDLHVRAR